MYTFFNFVIELVKIIIPSRVGSIGKSFLFYGFLLATGGAYYTLKYDSVNETLTIGAYDGNPNVILITFGLLFLVIGALLLWRTNKKIMSEQSLMYFANTLEQGDSKAPIYAMEKNDRVNPISKYLKKINTYDKNEVLKNYETNLDLFQERVEHKDINKIYLAALGSAPYLFLLGSLIRNGHIQNEILDYNRDKDRWYTVSPIGEELTHTLMHEEVNTTVKKKLTELCSNNSKEIGIALAYTFPINKESIPQELQENTIYLTHNLGFSNDKLSNIRSQSSLLNELTIYIDSIKSVNKKVHLFVSAQASFCIRLGKRYQDKTMGEICIHNFSGSDNGRVYDWHISFNQGKAN